MTHLFEVSENEMVQLRNEHKRFDILQFRRPVSTGDTILYQLEHKEPEDVDEDREMQPKDILQEYSVTIDFLFDDTEGALKKGFVGVGFKIEM